MEIIKKIYQMFLVVIEVIILTSIPIAIGLTPLWVWIDNGHSIYGGIDNTALSFGLGFIGTFLTISSGSIINDTF